MCVIYYPLSPPMTVSAMRLRRENLYSKMDTHVRDILVKCSEFIKGENIEV